MVTHHVLQSFIKLVPAATMLPLLDEQAINDNISRFTVIATSVIYIQY